MHTETLAAAYEDGPAQSRHITLRHAHLRVGVVADVLLSDGIDGVGTLWGFGVVDGELGNMTLTNDRYRSCQFVVHQRGLGLQADNVVGALVADELVSGDIYELYVLRHDEMSGNLVIDVDECLLQVALEDTGVILREAVDITDLDCVRLCRMDGH